MKVPVCIVLFFSAALFVFPLTVLGESDVDDVLSQDRTVGEDENKRYFLIGDALGLGMLELLAREPSGR